MENSFQTSFIPKKPMMASSVSVSGKEPVNFFSVIATLLLIVSILTAAGLFVYKIYLTKQKETLSSSLLINRDSFEKDTIDELELFNKRTDSAKKILSNHVILSPLFALLGGITIPQVQYTRFDQQIDDKGVVTVDMTGTARDYRSIALQADIFNGPKGSSLKNVLFSNLIKDKNNNVSFNLKFNVNPEILSYEKSVLLEQSTINKNTTTQVTPTVAPVTTTPVTETVTPVTTTPTPTQTPTTTVTPINTTNPLSQSGNKTQ